jgi:ATP-binding cassette subfamily F protein uup
MALVDIRNLSFTYGGIPLLDGISFPINAGERIGLMGRNGAGKSTLMKLLIGEIKPDSGDIDVAKGVKVARLPQEVPRGDQHTVFEEIAEGLGEPGRMVARLHMLTIQTGGDEQARQVELDRLHHEVDHDVGWKLHQQIDDIVARMNLTPETRFDALSSGMKRRVLLARTLVDNPDVLLLDEPTNHLDIEAVQWLEEFLLRAGPTLVFVTHDRAFLQRLATRIIEVERGRLFDWTCDYETFLVRKEAALEAEAQQQALFDKKLASEEVWVRTGIKARRTRNEGRVRALEKLREERKQRREKAGSATIVAQEAERSGMLVASVQEITHSYGDRNVLNNVSAIVSRGDKIGIIGPNGAGKTTLLRVLLGELTPQKGKVRLGSNLQVAYFDQLRDLLDEEKTAQENVAEGRDTVIVNGMGRHIVGYLQDFLFSPDRARTLVRYLSGGERNRLMLAKMFTKPSNVLVLDEPTNDLDAETLELLEDLLVNYSGTVLLVSHDRQFLNNVVTSSFVFEGDGRIKEYAGGYDDWVRQRSLNSAALAGEKAKTDAPASAAVKKTKLSYKEQRELEELPARIEKLEAEQAVLHEKMSEPGYYQKANPEIATTATRLEKIDADLKAAYKKWEELEAK